MDVHEVSIDYGHFVPGVVGARVNNAGLGRDRMISNCQGTVSVASEESSGMI